ncbi:MAG: efflux RND transporter periplasmic adaptor subunit [Clostridiales bacterium]|nr:efflux RND transporter periplasmic adaptor subunit [Clostridiales bacterium]
MSYEQEKQATGIALTDKAFAQKQEPVAPSFETKPGSRAWRFFLPGLLAFWMLAATMAGCSPPWRSGNAATPGEEAAEEPPLPVVVAPVERKDMEKTMTLGGLLKPQEEVVLMGGGAGSRILRVAVSVGDSVTKGQVILTQDMRDLDIQQQNLQISKTQLEDSYRTLEDNYQTLEDTYEKNKLLYEAGALAESQITSLESQLTSLESQMAGLENQMKQIDLQLETIRLNREKMAVTSTIDGVISTLPVIEGQMAAASTVVAQVVNIEKLLLDVQIGETYIMGVQKGDLMEIYIPAYSSEPVEGRVKTIPPNINPQSRAYTVTVEVDNPDMAIKGGMYAEMHIVVDRIESALVIPQFAVLRLEDGQVVFVEEGGVAQRRPVTLGLTLGEEAQILDGLREGERVIVEGQYSATEGRVLNVLSRGGAQ